MGQYISKTKERIEKSKNEIKNEYKQPPRRSPSHDNFVHNLEEVLYLKKY